MELFWIFWGSLLNLTIIFCGVISKIYCLYLCHCNIIPQLSLNKKTRHTNFVHFGGMLKSQMFGGMPDIPISNSCQTRYFGVHSRFWCLAYVKRKIRVPSLYGVAWSCQNVCDALTFLLDNIFIRFGTKLYRQVVGIPMGTNCAPLVADLFLFCYERDFMMSLSDDKQADVIDAFNTTSRYLDDILNINNVYFENMVSQIYPSELQLNKANASDTEAAFLDLHLSISNDIVSTKIYYKRDDFDFEIVNFPFLDGDVPRSTSYGVYISQLIRFARASSYVTDFNTRNKLLTQKLLKQGYRYHKLRKTFSKFYRRYFDLISKFQVGLKSLLRQGLSEPDFYGDLVYKLKKIVGSNNFSAQFIKIISHYKKIGYNINVLQQTACLVVNPITVGNFAFLFNCTPVGRTSDSMMVPT